MIHQPPLPASVLAENTPAGTDINLEVAVEGKPPEHLFAAADRKKQLLRPAANRRGNLLTPCKVV